MWKANLLDLIQGAEILKPLFTISFSLACIALIRFLIFVLMQYTIVEIQRWTPCMLCCYVRKIGKKSFKALKPVLSIFIIQLTLKVL